MIRPHSIDPSDEKTIRAYPPYEGPGMAGFIIDFLGIKTRTDVMSFLAPYSGTVEGYPFPCNWHATATEFAAVLRAVQDAEGSFMAAELGAGWGPWLITGATVARRRGIKNIQLLGVEGSQKHIRLMQNHFRDNGFDPDEHRLIHAVAGGYDGRADFGIIPEERDEWAYSAFYMGETSTAANEPRRGGNWRRLLQPAARLYRKLRPRQPQEPSAIPRGNTACFKLETLLEPWQQVDFVHVDIQGAEYDVLSQARHVLLQKVKRVIIGTHGRHIEEQLFKELGPQGWQLESEEACVYQQQQHELQLHLDGCQVWRNPRFQSSVQAADARAA